MRPDPEQTETQSGRIIYLGDVRRRRSGGRAPAPNRISLLALGLIAAASWTVWLAVVVGLPPYRLLTYLAFFTPLLLAVSSTAAIAMVLVHWRRGIIPSIPVCVRRGLAFGLVVVANLAVQAAHLWTWPVGVVTIAAMLMVDAFFSRRNR